MMVQKSNDFCGLPPHEKGHESMETMGSLRRTDYCGELSLADAGREMTVCGSIARARDKGGIIFADLRDTTGILQLEIGRASCRERV